MPIPPIITRPSAKDLGDGFVVRRVLPMIERRRVGPFVFLDEMGPVTLPAGQGLDVRPHPHIGLSTVTYLFSGAIEHKDTLATHQVIRPGDVNLMTAGRGIVHSERSPAPRDGQTLHGLQYWMALPQALEEIEPAFEHTPGARLPRWSEANVEATLVMGTHGQHRSPVTTYMPTLVLDLAFGAGGTFTAGEEGMELGVYVISGTAEVSGVHVESGTLASLDGQAVIAAASPARVVAFGGAPLDGDRRLWWNFVSSRIERIEQAKHAYASGAMGLPPGETEFIPLPP